MAAVCREGLATGLYKVAKADKLAREEQIAVARERAAAAKMSSVHPGRATPVRTEQSCHLSSDVKVEVGDVKSEAAAAALEGEWDYGTEGDTGLL